MCVCGVCDLSEIGVWCVVCLSVVCRGLCGVYDVCLSVVCVVCLSVVCSVCLCGVCGVCLR